MSSQRAPVSILSGPELEPEELKYFSKVIEDLAGIALKPAKHDLVKARLRSRLTALGFESYVEYREHLQSLSKTDPEWEFFVNMLTTNKTDFFREPQHFDFLVKSILPGWIKSTESTFKVWSAASSTGEEAYTLAMVLARHIPAGRDFKILATDIDTNVIQTGQNAVYSMMKKDEIPGDYQQRSIEIGRGTAKGWFRIKSELKEKVIFKPHNLIESTSPGENIFDLVLCRNVLIYFDKKTIQFVSDKLHSTTRPQGYLFIGHSESFQGIVTQWKPAGPSVFKKSGQ